MIWFVEANFNWINSNRENFNWRVDSEFCQISIIDLSSIKFWNYSISNKSTKNRLFESFLMKIFDVLNQCINARWLDLFDEMKIEWFVKKFHCEFFVEYFKYFVNCENDKNFVICTQRSELFKRFNRVNRFNDESVNCMRLFNISIRVVKFVWIFSHDMFWVFCRFIKHEFTWCL